MKAHLSDKYGKKQINKLTKSEINAIANGLKLHQELLETFCESLQKSEYYKDYSICKLIRFELFRKASSKRPPKSISLELHEEFVFFDAMRTLQQEGNPYEKSIAYQLIALIHSQLPFTEKTGMRKIESKIN
ncbi:hypothetical protein [Mesonia aquimarina]|uniref:hypothetical protein n=1 Tax=Mesonia aquimarina TaxID=1504967 RepID=UPI000EF573C3|nr:hypothetical protein [Mesonia aquimarina]